MRIRSLVLAATMLAAVSSPALAQARKAGLWQISATVSMPNLASVTGDFIISTGYDVYSLTDIQAPLLTKIGGQLFVTGQNGSSPNTLMTNLNGFSSLTSAQSVTIINNQALTNFTGLKNIIPSLSAANWSVNNNLYNPSYQDMVDGKYIIGTP